MDERIDLTEKRDFMKPGARAIRRLRPKQEKFPWQLGIKSPHQLSEQDRRHPIKQGLAYSIMPNFIEGENCDCCGKTLSQASWLRDFNLCLVCSKFPNVPRIPW